MTPYFNQIATVSVFYISIMQIMTTSCTKDKENSLFIIFMYLLDPAPGLAGQNHVEKEDDARADVHRP